MVVRGRGGGPPDRRRALRLVRQISPHHRRAPHGRRLHQLPMPLEPAPRALCDSGSTDAYPRLRVVPTFCFGALLISPCREGAVLTAISLARSLTGTRPGRMAKPLPLSSRPSEPKARPRASSTRYGERRAGTQEVKAKKKDGSRRSLSSIGTTAEGSAP